MENKNIEEGERRWLKAIIIERKPRKYNKKCKHKINIYATKGFFRKRETFLFCSKCGGWECIG